MKSWGKIIVIVAAVCFNTVVNAFESGTDYNSANMSYMANSTISQIVVFNSAMQSGGTLTFSVEAHAGGGRNLQHDTGQLKLEYYNGGTLLGSSTTSYATGNLLQMNSWSSGPGDNSEPWSTLTLTSTDCGTAGSCASVTHVKVIMIGTDTSWWAGNYGPQWRVPTVTFTPTGGSAGSNILYNPEFGVAPNGSLAQGWTSSTSWGTCGTTSGSVMCTTVATGVTANMSGGGYDATGGTTSGAAGGYTGTLSVTSFSGSSSGGGSPTVVSTAPGTPNVTSSSSNGTTTTTVVDTLGSTTVVETVTDTRGSATNKTLTVTRSTTQVATTPVTRVTTDTTPVTTTTVTTPTTVTTYSDGSITTTNGTPVTTTTTTDQTVTTTTTFNQVVTTGSDQDYTTRIDQYAVLAQTNSFSNLLNSNNILNRHTIIDGDLVFRGNVDTGRSVSFYTLGERTAEYSYDGYTIASNRYGFGLDKLVRNNWVVGVNLSRFESNMNGNNASGNLYKDVITLNSTNIIKNWILSSQLGYSHNTMDSAHSLPTLGYSNSSRTNGDDLWFTARLYTLDFYGLRPFVGGRVENNRRDAVTESGSALTAMSHDAVNTTTNTAHYGVRFDRNVNSFNFYAEASQNSNNVIVSRMGVGKQLTEKVAVILGATYLKKDSISSTAGSIMLRIGF